jgi:hypothetical protein
MILLAIAALVAVVVTGVVLTLVALFATRMMLFVSVTENAPFILVALLAWMPVAIWIKMISLLRTWFRNQDRILINNASLAEGEQILTKARWLAKVTTIILLFTTVSTILGLQSISTSWALTVEVATAPALTLFLTGATTFALTRALANLTRDLEARYRLLMPMQEIGDIGVIGIVN